MKRVRVVKRHWGVWPSEKLDLEDSAKRPHYNRVTHHHHLPNFVHTMSRLREVPGKDVPTSIQITFR